MKSKDELIENRPRAFTTIEVDAPASCAHTAVAKLGYRKVGGENFVAQDGRRFKLYAAPGVGDDEALRHAAQFIGVGTPRVVVSAELHSGNGAFLINRLGYRVVAKELFSGSGRSVRVYAAPEATDAEALRYAAKFAENDLRGLSPVERVMAKLDSCVVTQAQLRQMLLEESDGKFSSINALLRRIRSMGYRRQGGKYVRID